MFAVDLKFRGLFTCDKIEMFKFSTNGQQICGFTIEILSQIDSNSMLRILVYDSLLFMLVPKMPKRISIEATKWFFTFGNQ